MAFTTRLPLLAILLAVGCAGDPHATECNTGITCPEGTKCAAVQQVCIINDCGDGIVQSSEVCDDGNILDGDGCAANCLSREECGDNVLSSAAGEICDDNNTDDGDGCAADCRSIEICGNGIRDVQEVCDDGNTVPGDGCNGNCTSTEICGNGIVDFNEKCDDGDTPGGCNDDCQGGTGCGDGAIDRAGDGTALEECDDGNMDNFDDCTDDCHLNVCGDTIIQARGVRVEDCEFLNGETETAGCNIDCTAASCGDGIINNAASEQCDDGPGMNANDRRCTAACRVNVCGDGHVNLLGPGPLEQCDDVNGDQADGCTSLCRSTAVCGNGVLEQGEACDDGNTTDDDGCGGTGLLACKFESCGDGVENNGEPCDDSGESLDCNIDCTPSVCGDGKVNQTDGEECDDANLDEDDACRNDCKVAFCGDGVVGPGELCDDGNADNIACNAECTTPTCRNGVLEGTEECDDGNTNDNDGCRNTCVYAECGDGVVYAGVEQCDNGAAGNGDTKDCLTTCKTNVCGDGFQDLEGSDKEECDDGNQIEENECPYGVQSCVLCDDTCETDLPLGGNICGDNVVDTTNEMCDDGNAITDSECAYGAPNGTCSVCNATCTASVPETGPYCGDGATQGSFGEACDDRSTTQSCGTCDNGCNVFKGPTAATGFIVAPPGPPMMGGGSGNLADGDTITIDDGFGHVVLLEFDVDGSGVTAGRRDVDAPAGATAASVADEIRDAINGSTLLIQAEFAGTTGLTLTHQRLSAKGNQTISTTVDAGIIFIAGMSGGAARDCADGAPCDSDDDCENGDCNGSTHVCQ